MSSGPLIYQCLQCRTIVGDSLRTVGNFETLNALAVEVCTNVAASEALQTDGEQSTYKQLYCACCSSMLGRAYIRAPPHLEALVGAITFDLDSLQSYPLGSALQTASSLPVVNSHNNGIDDGTTGSNAAYGGSGSVIAKVEEDLRAELHKLQMIILSLNERVVAIESRDSNVVVGNSAPAKAKNGQPSASSKRKK